MLANECALQKGHFPHTAQCYGRLGGDLWRLHRIQAYGQDLKEKNGRFGFWSKSLLFLLPKILEWPLVSNIQIKLTIKKIVLSQVWTSPDAELGFSISAKFLSVYVHHFGKLSCYHQNSLAFSFCDTGLKAENILGSTKTKWMQIKPKTSSPLCLFFQEHCSAPRQSLGCF